MKILKTNKKHIKSDVDLIVRYLKQGKVVVLPTDTVYGLSSFATSQKAMDKVRKIKKSDKSKPILVLVSGLGMLKKYTKISKKQLDYLRKIWIFPAKTWAKNVKKALRPTTVILENKNNKLKYAAAGQDNIAVRLPNNEFLCKIISRAGVPVASTSLNISGEEIISCPGEIEKKFKILPDLLVEAGKSKKIKHSRLIDIRDINNIKVIRK